MSVSSFNFVGLTEKRDKNLMFQNLRERKWTKFQLYVPLSPWEKKRWKFFDIWKLERKKNEEIKGKISRRNLVLFHIKQQMIHNTCTKL